MLLNTTYQEKEHKHLLIDVVGSPFSLLEKLKMGGVGSKRMIVGEASPNLKPYLNLISDINYANIELRKKGILIYLNKGLKNFTWAIPFYQLAVFKTNGASIHAQGRFIHFKNNKLFHENKRFFKKLMNQKLKYDMEFNLR